MGLKGEAAILGFVELPARRSIAGQELFSLQQWARLAGAAVEDAGVRAEEVNGIVTSVIAEASQFVPSTITEYLGIEANFAEIVDLGGCTAVSSVWRAAAVVELGAADAVLCTIPGSYSMPQSQRRANPMGEERFYGSSSNTYGSPQAEFDIPYGNLGQNAPYAQVARRYAYEYGYDPRAMAKIAVDQRTNAQARPEAAFYGTPMTIDDVLASPMIADPLHLLEIVMPVHGGAAVLVGNADMAKRSKHRPVWIKGFGERVPFKTHSYVRDLMSPPIVHAAEQAFSMAGLAREDVDMVSLYDCYTITVLLTLEAAGFCPPGAGMAFVRDHDLTYRGDFPMNTSGGQLSYGQPGKAGGMHHVVDATRQIMGRAELAQVPDCNIAFVSGNGGVLGEQAALVLVGE